MVIFCCLLGAGALCIEDLDAIDLSLLGHTICLGADGSRDVCSVAVAIAVLSITSKVLEELGAALEFLFS